MVKDCEGMCFYTTAEIILYLAILAGNLYLYTQWDSFLHNAADVIFSNFLAYMASAAHFKAMTTSPVSYSHF